MGSRTAGRSDRLYGFDAVRGLAAVAVVALHAAYPYALAPLPGLVWPVPIDQPSRFADACFWAIEGFVMPLFFAVSGYFLARSLSRQTPGEVVAGRTGRLVVSFWTVGIVVLAFDLMIWTAGFAATGQATWNDFRRMKFGPAIDDHLWGPGHLWYLEYLWVLCAGSCVAATLWQGFLRQFGPFLLTMPRVERGIERVESPPALVGFAGLSAAAAALLAFHPEVVLGFQHHFIVPAWPKLAHGGVFLLFGVLLHRSGRAVEMVRRAAPVLLAAAAAAFVVLLPRIRDAMLAGAVGGQGAVFGALLAAYAVTATLGCLGAGLRWLDRPAPRLARLAAASFWVYVFHHPLVGLLQLAVRPVEVSPAVKFAVVTGVSLAACLFTYGRFVEGRAIGRMLDGEPPWRALRRRESEPATPAPVPSRKAA